MKPTALGRVGAIGLLATCGLLAGGTAVPQGTAPAAAAGEKTWRLVADYQLDGRVEPRETNRVVLAAEGGRLAGHFLHHRANGKDNSSSFTGEILGLPVLHRGPAGTPRESPPAVERRLVTGGG